MAAARLDVENLSAGYGPTQIITDMSFAVPAGDRLAILGRNGVGKTTLLATLMGLSTRHRGRIKIDGHDLADSRASSRARLGVGYAMNFMREATEAPDPRLMGLIGAVYASL